MNELINGNAIKMTSIEIAELVGKRHDNVKRTIETLAKNGVIRLPQIEVSERINNLGFNVQYEHYVFEGEQGNGMLSVNVYSSVTKACVSCVCVLVWCVRRRPLTTSSLNRMAALMSTVICRVCAGRVIRRRRPVNG